MNLFRKIKPLFLTTSTMMPVLKGAGALASIAIPLYLTILYRQQDEQLRQDAEIRRSVEEAARIEREKSQAEALLAEQRAMRAAAEETARLMRDAREAEAARKADMEIARLTEAERSKLASGQGNPPPDAAPALAGEVASEAASPEPANGSEVQSSAAVVPAAATPASPHRTFSVLGSSQFSLCGHDSFEVQGSSNGVMLTNKNRSFSFRKGFGFWQSHITTSEPVELFPKCTVSFTQRKSQGVDYLVVSEYTPPQ